MKNTNLQNGISLIETIIYVAIFSVFIIGFAQFSNILSATRLHNQIVLEVNDQGSQIIRLITQTVRNGSAINSPTVGNLSSSLSIDTGVPGTNPTMFSVTSGVLYVAEAGGSPVPLTNNKVAVSNLTFSNFSRASTPNIIKVSFALTSVSARDPYVVTFSGSGALRK